MSEDRKEMEAAWVALLGAVKTWSKLYMDQWEMIKFPTEYGPVYVTITREPGGRDQDFFEEV